MIGMYNPAFFYPVALLIILFAILTIKFKNIFYSLISSIVVFFLVGLLFYLLGSEYNAIIQIAIYGVAVPIILGLAVMFTDFKKDKVINNNKMGLWYLLILISGIFIIAILYLAKISLVINPQIFNISENIGNNYVQVMSAFSSGIFVKYVWAFELTSVILTIIVVGLILLRKKKGEE